MFRKTFLPFLQIVALHCLAPNTRYNRENRCAIECIVHTHTYERDDISLAVHVNCKMQIGKCRSAHSTFQHLIGISAMSVCVERNTSVRCAHDLVAQQSRRLASIQSRLMPISLCINSTNNPINKLVSLLRQIRCFDLSCRVQLHLSDWSRDNLTSSVNFFSVFFWLFFAKFQFDQSTTTTIKS